VLIQVGKTIANQNIVFTSNLFHSGGYEDHEKRHALIKQGIALLKKPDPEDSVYNMLRVIKKDVWMIVDGDGITFLKPEDY
jgi:hypothetical protein